MRMQIRSQHNNRRLPRNKKSPVNHTKLHHNCITSSLVILYKYLFAHDFVRLAHGFIHVLTKFYCSGSTLTLSLVFKSVFAYWPREIVALSSDSIAICNIK